MLINKQFIIEDTSLLLGWIALQLSGTTTDGGTYNGLGHNTLIQIGGQYLEDLSSRQLSGRLLPTK